MDNEQKTPSAESLRQMPYSELKKIAKQRGIKGNLKAEKIIAALVSADSDDTDSFSTPAAKIVNSSRKKKVEKFNVDSMTPLVTPRRGTYSVGTPIALKNSETSPSSVANDSSVLDMSNVTVGRGSERKLRSCKIEETSPSSMMNESSVLNVSNFTASVGNDSLFNVSNVTVGRGSERKTRGRKVSFLSPVMTPHTPRNSNLKMRPKTPIVSRTPFAATMSPSQMKELKVNLGERVDVSLPLTPLPEKTSEELDNKKSVSFLASNEMSAKKMPQDAKKSTSLLKNNEMAVKKKSISTPKLTKSSVNENQLEKKKRLATPNFKKIHEKAFDKMESIDDYQKRVVNSAKKLGVVNFKGNKVTKAKSKIPACGGIPFIPSVSMFSGAKWSAMTLNNSKPVEEKKKLIKKDVENTRISTRSKSKFDLKASLSRKLGYKPYTGKLKPLTPSSVMNTSVINPKNKPTPAKEPVNKVVTSNRMQSRSILKGVRTNKRFELQMKNRMLQ